MAKTTARKQKLSKKASAVVRGKKIKKQKKSKLTKPGRHDSDSDSDPNTDIQTLLEPFSKEQLIALVIDLSSSDDQLFSLVQSAADQDIGHRKIFVHGLGWDTTSQSIEPVFKAYGEIEELNVPSDRATGKCKGYAFLTFKSRKSAQNLLKNPRFQVENRLISCQLASEGPPGPASAGIISQKQFSASDYPQRKIYVSNVPLNASPEKLRVFFEKFGEIESGPKGMDPTTGRFKGYAIFVFKAVDGAKKVLEEPTKLFEGSQLHCRKANEGKILGAGGAASITTALQPVQPQMLAAVAAAQQVQNMALLGQQAGFGFLSIFFFLVSFPFFRVRLSSHSSASMATEELNKPSSLPPYPQMIMEAIDALKQAEGASKTSISEFMESKYGELSADLLTAQLTAMKDSGELLLIENNYFIKPSSDAPPKRGRGRPPKPKEAQPAEAVLAPPRPRGRPKKDPNAPPAPKKLKTSAGVSKTGRPRGRPRKVQPEALQNGVEA